MNVVDFNRRILSQVAIKKIPAGLATARVSLGSAIWTNTEVDRQKTATKNMSGQSLCPSLQHWQDQDRGVW